MANSGLPDAKFDAVISVFSLFFVPDMERMIAELWRLVRPGGQLAVTVWGPHSFEPWMSIFGEEVCRERPDFAVATRPWERLTDPANLRRLFLDGGAAAPSVEAVSDRQLISQPEDWWTIGIGSGFRWEIGQLTPDQAQKVRARTLDRLSQVDDPALCTNANYAIATKAI